MRGSIIGRTPFVGPRSGFLPKTLRLGQSSLVFGQRHGPTRFHEAVARTGWIRAIIQIGPEIRFPNATHGIFAGASQRGRSAEIRKAQRVIRADRHTALTRLNHVARVDGRHIKPVTNLKVRELAPISGRPIASSFMPRKSSVILERPRIVWPLRSGTNGFRPKRSIAPHQITRSDVSVEWVNLSPLSGV
jgi:hypothetical protein